MKVRLLLAFCLGCMAACSRTPSEATSPNVLLVTLDTTRADALPGFGADPKYLPNFAKWVDESTRFTNAYTSAPITLPAHASLFSGQYPATHGVRSQFYGVNTAPTLGLLNAAKKAGYKTGAFVATNLLEPGRSKLHGFDFFSGPQGMDRPMPDVLRAAERWVNNQPRSQPLLVWIHLFDAHMPYRPLIPYWNKCPKEKRAEALALTTASGRPATETFKDAFWAECLDDLYRSQIVDMDRHIPQLRELFSKRGPYRWVVLGDHGECLGEEGTRGQHAATLLECALHIPLFFGGWQETKPGHDDHRLANIVDIAPSITKRMRWDPFPSDGLDLFAAPQPERTMFFEAMAFPMPQHEEDFVGYRNTSEKAVLNLKTKKLRLWNVSPTTGELTELGETEFSERGKDALAKLLQRSAPPPIANPRELKNANVSDNDETLRALGYIQ